MPITPTIEARRLDTLASLDILDTPKEPAFDRLTALSKRIFGVSMSTLTLIDGHRQWFKAEVGMADRETDRRPALCSLAIAQDTPSSFPTPTRIPASPTMSSSADIRSSVSMPACSSRSPASTSARSV